MENDNEEMDNLPGTALYRATLEHYRPAFCATAATLDEKEAIVQRFLDCFMFQNPVVNEDSMREDGTTTQSTDWLVLGAHSARTMLYEALSQPVSSMSSTTRTSRSKPVPYNAHAAKTAAPGLTIKSSAATSTGSATTATSRTKRLPAMKKVPDGMSSCSGDSDDSDSDDASFVPTKPSRFATRTATAAANKTKPTNAHRRPVVYCYKGSHYSKVAANVAFVELIRSHIREYLNASEGRQEAIIDDIADRFEFALGPDANGPWKCPTEEWIRNKIYNSLTRTKPPENTVSTPKSRQLRSSPQKSPTKATREKASMSRVAQMTTLNKNTAAAAAAPTKALSMETLNRIAASTGKLVVYCGFAGPGYSGEPGNAAYVERMHETHGEYCSAASNVTKKEAIVDAILDEFDFYRPINASLTLWTKADAAWTRRKVSRRLTLLGTEVATAATRASTMDE
jgi:hypothetical protein